MPSRRTIRGLYVAAVRVTHVQLEGSRLIWDRLGILKGEDFSRGEEIECVRRRLRSTILAFKIALLI